MTASFTYRQRIWYVMREHGVGAAARRARAIIAEEGAKGLAVRAGIFFAGVKLGGSSRVAENYRSWVRQYDTMTPALAGRLRQDSEALLAQGGPLISVLMPVHNPPLAFLKAAIESVRDQIYPRWQLCIADDASTDPAVRALLQSYAEQDDRISVAWRDRSGHIAAATNTALGFAKGEFVAFLDHDDTLAPHALYCVAREIVARPHLCLIYSDEDKLSEVGRRCEPNFKPDWNPDLMRSQNYICHLAVYRRSLVTEVGGLRQGFDGAQDYDLALRVVDRLDADQMCHIPRVLYHWRIHAGSTAHGLKQKRYAVAAAIRALSEHLGRNGIRAAVTEAGDAAAMYRVHYPLPARLPKVSIIILTRNRLDLLRQCVESIRYRTTYPHVELIVLDNGSDDPATLDYLKRLGGEQGATVVRDDRPFNFSALNNVAAGYATGDVLVFLNNDIEVINAEWLHEMVSHALRPEIGAVGARLWYPNDSLQHAGIIMVGGVAGHAHKYLNRGEKGYFGRSVLIQNFSAMTAACLAVRRQVYDEVGGFDESIAVAFNDVDFCLRARELGYCNVWTPYAELYHHESASRGQEDSLEKQKRFEREALFMMARWPDAIAHDPAYNPNLDNMHEDFRLAFPPRVAPLSGYRPHV